MAFMSLIVLAGAVIGAATGPEPRTQPLAPAAMAQLVGGDACRDCTTSGGRLDECYHASTFDACATNQCIANYLLEDTCLPGPGICNAALDHDVPIGAQYRRVDTNCTTNNPYTYVTVKTDYFGHDCTPVEHKMRCDKPTNNCNGTLIASGTRYPGINCQ